MPDRDPGGPDEPDDTDGLDGLDGLDDGDAFDLDAFDAGDLEPALPVRRIDDGVVLDLGVDETALVRRLLVELRAMLTADDPGEEATALLVRLFPAAYPGDDDKEAEYQRLMRDELVQSKLAAFDVVDEALDGSSLDEGRQVAVMQSINSIRLVLGVMLDVSDDADDEIDDRLATSPEYALYTYLSWLLELLVTSAG